MELTEEQQKMKNNLFKKSLKSSLPKQQPVKVNQNNKYQENMLNLTNINADSDQVGKFLQTIEKDFQFMNKQQVSVGMLNDHNRILNKQCDILNQNQKQLANLIQKNNNNKKISDKDIIDQNKEIMTQLLEPVNKQIMEIKAIYNNQETKFQHLKQELTDEIKDNQQADLKQLINSSQILQQKMANTSENLQQIHPQQLQELKNMKNFNVNQYTTVIDQLQNQIQGLLKENENIQIQSNQKYIKMNQKNQQEIELIEQDVENKLNQIDINKTKQYIDRKLGGRFDYEAFLVEVNEIVDDSLKIQKTYKQEIQQYKIQIPSKISYKNIDFKKQISVLDQFKNKKGISFENNNVKLQEINYEKKQTITGGNVRGIKSKPVQHQGFRVMNTILEDNQALFKKEQYNSSVPMLQASGGVRQQKQKAKADKPPVKQNKQQYIAYIPGEKKRESGGDIKKQTIQNNKNNSTGKKSVSFQHIQEPKQQVNIFETQTIPKKTKGKQIQIDIDEDDNMIINNIDNNKQNINNQQEQQGTDGFQSVQQLLTQLVQMQQNTQQLQQTKIQQQQQNHPFNEVQLNNLMNTLSNNIKQESQTNQMQLFNNTLQNINKVVKNNNLNANISQISDEFYQQEQCHNLLQQQLLEQQQQYQKQQYQRELNEVSFQTNLTSKVDLKNLKKERKVDLNDYYKEYLVSEDDSYGTTSNYHSNKSISDNIFMSGHSLDAKSEGQISSLEQQESVAYFPKNFDKSEGEIVL